MPIHFVKKKWTDRPPAGTPPRADGHWSTQGLIALVALNEGGGSIAVNAFGPNGSVYPGAGGVFDGKGFTTLVNTSDEYIDLGAVLSGRISDKITIASLMTINAVPTTNRAYHGAGNPLGTFAFALYSKTSGEFVYRLDSSVNTAYYGASVVVAGRTYLNVLRYDGAYVSAFLNGAKDISDQAQTGNVDNTSQSVKIGYTGSTSVKTAAVTHKLFAIWNRALTDVEIKQLTDNPWQMFRPALVPVVIPSSGTTYTETLYDAATAVAAVTDIATRVETLLESIQAAGSVADAVTAVETLLESASVTDALMDAATRIESVADAITGMGSVSDALSGVSTDSIADTATAVAAVTDIATRVETLLESIQAAGSVADVVIAVETLLDATQGAATVADEVFSGAVENVLTTAIGRATATDAQTMQATLITLAQAGASASELGAFIEQVIRTAAVTASVSDAIIGAFDGVCMRGREVPARSFSGCVRPRSFIQEVRPCPC